MSDLFVEEWDGLWQSFLIVNSGGCPSSNLGL